jgi:tetratricopeptide (TPR) repeat protein
MNCPRCSQPSNGAQSCPRCGVVFAKLKTSNFTRAHVVTRKPLVNRRLSPGRLVSTTLLLLAIVVLMSVLRFSIRRTTAPYTRHALTSPPPGTVSVHSAVDVQPKTTDETPIVPSTGAPSNLGPLTAADALLAKSLSSKLLRRTLLTSSDLIAAETLFARYPQENAIRDLLHALLLLASSQAQQQRLYEVSRRCLQRASLVRPDQLENDRAFLSLHLKLGEWSLAEQRARRILARAPNDAEASRGLAFALMRLDRDREAAAVLSDLLDVRDDAEARALMSRIQKTMSDERGMKERRLSHFDVRYDGDAHEDVGRGILRVLERHYATLTITFGHQPSATIPVILFSRQAFFDASGAPTWSGGVYDAIDGRIRVPIGGLTERLTPELDAILIHELTHAFVADRTRGVAPRELHEGLAQYMEGKRIEAVLRPTQIDDLARGGIGGVIGFYYGALALVEYLIQLRGQGGINELLSLMGESGDVNEAFRRVYGKDIDALMHDSMRYHSRRATR